MQSQIYWNEIGSKKDFEDPLFIDKLTPYIYKSSLIVEYGCGYGRMLRFLKERGYKYLKGYDFALNMILRGEQENPDLDLRLLNDPGKIPHNDSSVDAVILSTILCCLIDPEEQNKLLEEILRILKFNGIIYITDFLLSNDELSIEKYHHGKEQFNEWGVYQTSEGLLVKHYSTDQIMNLLHKFDILWFEQFNFKTMNQNPARTFHCIARKGLSK